MDFDGAITAHAAWKQKLADYLGKKDGSLNAADLGADNKCPLGQWIHGEGVKHTKLAEYGKLKSEHARFHKAVAGIVKSANSGHPITEETAMGSKSEFAMASSAVVLAIMGMKKHAAEMTKHATV